MMRVLLAAPLLFGVGACTSTAGQVSESDLVGGAQVREDGFPGVVNIKNGVSCTGAKVGPRQFLLAAHCVADFETDPGKPRPEFAHGATVQIGYSRADTASTIEITVDDTFLPDVWAQNCNMIYRCYADANRLKSPDVAIIVAADDTPTIPSSVVDLDPAAPGDPVTVLGFGCEGDPNFDYSKARLKSGDTVIVPVTATRHEGSYVTDQLQGDIDTWYSITKGPALDPTAPGLCSGDSGGPLLRVGPATTTIVGVNSSSTYIGAQQPGQPPATNLFSRLDNTQGVGDFLASHGVALTHTKTAP